MGTRGITMVILGGEPVVAQYGQWDHYISGNGVVTLKFLHKGILDKLREKLKVCRFTTPEDEKEVDEFLKSIGCESGYMNDEQAKLFFEKYPYFTRNHGSNILNVIAESQDETILLRDSRDFVHDSLFCEYGYVIDLDKNTFEVYEGFNKSPLEETERFYKKNPEIGSSEYASIRLLKSYDLDKLPTVEEFLAELDPQEEQE
jgi:hypothetical protein